MFACTPCIRVPVPYRPGQPDPSRDPGQALDSFPVGFQGCHCNNMYMYVYAPGKRSSYIGGVWYLYVLDAI